MSDDMELAELIMRHVLGHLPDDMKRPDLGRERINFDGIMEAACPGVLALLEQNDSGNARAIADLRRQLAEANARAEEHAREVGRLRAEVDLLWDTVIWHARVEPPPKLRVGEKIASPTDAALREWYDMWCKDRERRDARLSEKGNDDEQG